MNSADGLAGVLIGAEQIEPGSDFMKRHPNHGQITRCIYSTAGQALRPRFRRNRSRLDQACAAFLRSMRKEAPRAFGSREQSHRLDSI